MYTRYFGFNEKPFTLTPNPRFIYLSNNHKEAFAHLLYGINNHYGFIELLGEVGTGKTTVLRTLLGQLKDENYSAALIFNPCLTGVELLRSINSEFGIDASSEYSNELLAELNRFLLTENAAGRTVVLVIDEAQNLQPEVLEQVRMISNLETENDKLIQIILSGQPELEALLDRPDLRQLNQRIAVRYRLSPIRMDETRAYIRHRMEVAGETGGISFSNNAIKLIHLYTHGVPRMINILCDRALLIAYGDERRRITPIIVTRGIREILNHTRTRRISRIAVVLVLLLIAAGLAGTVYVRSKKPAAVLPHPVSVAAPSAASDPISAGIPQQSPSIPVPATSATAYLQHQIRGGKQNEMHIRSFNALAGLWHVRPVKKFSGQLVVPKMFTLLASRRNLIVTEFKGSLEEVVRFNRPFLVETNVTGPLGGYCLAIVSADDTSLTTVPSLTADGTLPKHDLASLASGTYYLIWQNPGKIPVSISKGVTRFEIRYLHKLLSNAGFYRGPINGTYGDETIRAVNEFQKSNRIAVNSSLGELTLALLTRFDTSSPSPELRGK